MSNQNYIIEMLELKDNNIKFYENCYYKQKIKGITYKVFEGYLSYQPKYCDKCGILFDDHFEKHGFITSNIKIPDVAGYKTILKLHKQRYLCKHCNKAFTLKTNIVDYGCFISINTKWKIAKDLKEKRSEKDIALANNVSPNTVERVMDSYYNTNKIYKNYLPEVLSFDEFKSVKSADGAMSFNLCNGKTGKIIDIIENRQLNYLLKYYSYYTHEARKNVKFIVIDMYSPYISLILKLFPRAKIIIDKFHLVQLISRALNKTRINIMKKDKKNYNKLKRYWRLLLKSRDELDGSHWRKFACFSNLVTEIDVVDYLTEIDNELDNTYHIYQDLLYSIKNNNFKLLNITLNHNYNIISEYMKTSLKTIKEYLPYIKNTFENKYNNGFIEGNNNFIKVLKRIAFGFRSFRRFKARIMICKGLIDIKKEANA